MPRELTPRSLRLTHDDPKAQGEEGQPTVLQQVLEFRARFPVSGLSPGSAFTVSCVTGCSGGRWAHKMKTPYSCLFCTPSGLPLLFTGMWVGCKLTFEDVA